MSHFSCRHGHYADPVDVCRNWTYFEEVGNAEAGGYGGMDPSTRNVYRGSEDSATAGGEGVNDTQPSNRDRDHHLHPHMRSTSTSSSQTVRNLSWHQDNYAFDRKTGYPSTLGPVSAPNGTGVVAKPNHEHSHGLFCHHRNSKLIHKKGAQLQGGVVADNGNESVEPTSGLRIRMWLESRRKEEQGRAFAS